HGSMNFRNFEAVNGLRPPEAARNCAPLTASKLRKKEASMRSTALPARLAPVKVAPLEELTATHTYFLVVVCKTGNRCAAR
ncbi:MAG: hypothetical protein ABR878_16135, partial [Roseiarcus sp.]